MKNTANPPPKFNKGDKIAEQFGVKYLRTKRWYRIKRVTGSKYVMFNQNGTTIKKPIEFIDSFFIQIPLTPEETIDQLLAKYQ